MQTIQKGYRGASLLVQINADRLIMIGALGLALYAGAWMATL